MPQKSSLKATSGNRLKEAFGEQLAVSAGVVGLGLMGTSIATALLSAGHSVVGLVLDSELPGNAHSYILERLKEMQSEGLLTSDPELLIEKFDVTSDYKKLSGCLVVIESIVEDVAAKRTVIRKIEEVVPIHALIGTNTSGIPISVLQEGSLHPERILGIHWAEPAHLTRFMEIVCGKDTQPEYAELCVSFARFWGKEPTLLRRDIRGFITNRIMYAMLREAFYLVENGYATPADVDRSIRNDMGHWMTLAGPFRFMDLTGIPAYRTVMKDLLPELSRDTQVPPLMQKVADSGALGVANARGFYDYTPEQAKRWEELFLTFTYEIRALAQKYPENIGD
jgi:3-hydroxybutyryl-CoA dehydrogenase